MDDKGDQGDGLGSEDSLDRQGGGGQRIDSDIGGSDNTLDYTGEQVPLVYHTFKHRYLIFGGKFFLLRISPSISLCKIVL